MHTHTPHTPNAHSHTPHSQCTMTTHTTPNAHSHTPNAHSLTHHTLQKHSNERLMIACHVLIGGVHCCTPSVLPGWSTKDTCRYSRDAVTNCVCHRCRCAHACVRGEGSHQSMRVHVPPPCASCSGDVRATQSHSLQGHCTRHRSSDQQSCIWGEGQGEGALKHTYIHVYQ